MIDIKDKQIIISWAASGIGRGIAIECAKLWALVFALDIDDVSLKKLKLDYEDLKIETYKVDVSDYAQVNSFFDDLIERWFSPDCLVNNAWIYLGKNIFEYNNNEIDKVIDVNIKSALFLSKIFAQYNISKKIDSSIINISSVSWEEGSSDAVYWLTKSALIGLTKSNAINFSPYVRVNAIAPWLVDTEMLKNIPEKRLDAYRKNELIDKCIEPIDVANTVIFLLSKLARNYTWAIFDINNWCYLR